MKKILVTGANGFVGTALCDLLYRRGYELIPFVRSAGQTIAGVEYYVGDLGDDDRLRECLVGVDCVIHLAARAHVLNDRVADPLTIFRQVNRDMTLALARVARDEGVGRFIFVSSIGVNGAYTHEGRSFSELTEPAPQAAYAVSKLEAELALQDLLADSSMEYVIVRPPLVYAGDAPGNFRRLLRLVSTGVPLPFARVENRRSMIALENLADFLELCIRHSAAANQLFVISDGFDVSTPQIICNLAKGMDLGSRLFPWPLLLMRWGARLAGKQALYSQLYGSLVVDAGKAVRLLGWHPSVSAEAALVKAGRDYRLHVKR